MKIYRIPLLKWVFAILAAVSMVLVVAACDSSTPPGCDNVAHDLANARSVLSQDQTVLANAQKDGGAGEVDAQANVDADTAKVKALEACPVTPAPTPSTTTSPSTSVPTLTSTEPTAACSQTWTIKVLDHKDYALVGGGMASIRSAKTNAQAAKAAGDWLTQIQTDPYVLSAAIKTALAEDVDPAKLQDGTCASATAKVYVARLLLELSKAQITPGPAPVQATNTHIEHGRVVSSRLNQILGDRTAIKIKLSSGRTFWVLAVCGNIVTVTKTFPSGKVMPPFEVPKPTPTSTPTPTYVRTKAPQTGSCLYDAGGSCPQPRASQSVAAHPAPSQTSVPQASPTPAPGQSSQTPTSSSSPVETIPGTNTTTVPIPTS